MRSFVIIAQRAAALPIFVACVALFVLMVMTFADVILRSGFNAPIEAASELTRILMAVIVFSVLPVISANGGQISVDLTDHIFARFNLDRVRNVIVNLTCGALLIWPAQRVWILAERARDYGDITEYLHLPLFYIGWFISVSVLITAGVLIVTGVMHLVSPNLMAEIDR